MKWLIVKTLRAIPDLAFFNEFKLFDDKSYEDLVGV